LQPPPDVVSAARWAATGSGARLLVTDDVTTAVRGADFLYTDVWVSMGEPDEVWDTRVPRLLPYRITTDLLAATGKPTTKVLHCLPALHDAETSIGRRLADRFGLTGAEIADDVFTSDRTIVFDQAENRMHTIKAVLVAALER
jgi:ornithine carbamoyltransferase